MKDNFQTEVTLNNKEIECSAAVNLICLYLSNSYFEQPENVTIFFVYFFVIFWYQSLNRAKDQFCSSVYVAMVAVQVTVLGQGAPEVAAILAGAA